MVVSRMEKPPKVLKHLGPYCTDTPLSASCELTERVWLTYHNLVAGYQHAGQASREFLIVRMLYIAEITSTAIRLNASWALTHAALSLRRTVMSRPFASHGWCETQQERIREYERAMFAKMNSIVRNMDSATRDRRIETVGPLPAWATEQLTKEDRAAPTLGLSRSEIDGEEVRCATAHRSITLLAKDLAHSMKRSIRNSVPSRTTIASASNW